MPARRLLLRPAGRAITAAIEAKVLRSRPKWMLKPRRELHRAFQDELVSVRKDAETITEPFGGAAAN